MVYLDPGSHHEVNQLILKIIRVQKFSILVQNLKTFSKIIFEKALIIF